MRTSFTACLARPRFWPWPPARTPRRRSRSEPPQMQFPGWGVNPADLDPCDQARRRFRRLRQRQVEGGDRDPGQISLLRRHHQSAHRRRESGPRRSSTISPRARTRPGSRRAAGRRHVPRLSGRRGDQRAPGMAPAKPYLDRIAAVKNHEDLAALWGDRRLPAPFGEFVSIDRGDPTRNTCSSGLAASAFPTATITWSTMSATARCAPNISTIVTFLLGKAGDPSPRADAEAVYALEKKMAAVMWDRAVARNPQLTTNRLSYDRAAGASPAASRCKRYLDARGIARRPTASTSSRCRRPRRSRGQQADPGRSSPNLAAAIRR